MIARTANPAVGPEAQPGAAENPTQVSREPHPVRIVAPNPALTREPNPAFVPRSQPVEQYAGLSELQEVIEHREVVLNRSKAFNRRKTETHIVVTIRCYPSSSVN